MQPRKPWSRMSAKCTAASALLFACAGLAAPSAFGQGGPVQQSGQVVPGHVPQFITNGVVADGGPANDGKIKELGITNTGTPFCISDAPLQQPHHTLCLGAGGLTYQAYGGATPKPLTCTINGVTAPCFGSPGRQVHHLFRRHPE